MLEKSDIVELAESYAEALSEERRGLLKKTVDAFEVGPDGRVTNLDDLQREYPIIEIEVKGGRLRINDLADFLLENAHVVCPTHTNK